MKLSVPETVNDWNLAYLKKFVQNGPDTYPGANYLIRPDGKKKKITDETKEALLEEIQPGYIVERHLMDGDIALFNRQPSLHRMSMMCHRIKVLPGRTFRLNPAVCAPYNADFDGDEMNLHVPQSEEARAEAQILMEVSTQLISPRYGACEIGAIQDGISGNYYLTRHLNDISREFAVELLACAGVYDFGRLPKKEKLTGKDVFSALLPDDFNYIGESRSGEKVVIKDGKVVEGIIDTLAIGGEGEGALLRALHKRYGPQRTIDILHHAFRLGIEVLLRTGLSVNVGNSDLTPDARDDITKLMQDAESEVQELIRQFQQGTLEASPGKTPAQTLESKTLERLNRARNACKSIVEKHTTDRNHTALIIRSGARGSMLNMVQMGAVVGQQALRGGRIDKGYRGRTISCFQAGDLSPAARGFIRSSYKSGLNPKEFFFGSITARDALMDTALRTPKSGYLYRRLANALQDIRVEYDGTVRDANGRIIQFDYGDDGIDVARSEGGKIDVDRIIEMTE
jgi:DNA-directed RNA polymerase subunit A'